MLIIKYYRDLTQNMIVCCLTAEFLVCIAPARPTLYHSKTKQAKVQ